MRTHLLLAMSLAAVAPVAAQDYHFTKNLAAGDRLQVSNINGSVDVRAATGRIAEVSVTKIVKRGDGAMVKAIMDEGGTGMRVCTVYLDRDPNRHTCDGDNSSHDRRGRDDSQIEMHYVVRIPAGARLDIDDVNGNVTVTGADADARVATVNGDVLFDGVGASSLESVNGKVVGTFSHATWDGTMSIETVNGSVDLTFPPDLSTDISGETVNGGVDSRFPITIEHGWGPKSFNGRIGAGGRKLKISTVNGGITLRKR